MVVAEALVVAGLVGRGRRGRVEAERDWLVLGWIARFRFVDARVLAWRFGVSLRRVNARVTRLEAAGLVGCARRHDAQARTIFVSRRGAVALGLGPRRAPRVEVQRTDELALAALVARIETTSPGLVVLTEREGRARQADGAGRFSVVVSGGGGSRALRWPDLVVHTGRRRVALELELAAKTTERLTGIVGGYLDAGVFDEVRFLVGSPALARRLSRVCTDPGPAMPARGHPLRLTSCPVLGVDSANQVGGFGRP
ncbi:MAG: hypothetical protein KY469_22805 [Actinobacteria bacterium]|nr:hypothetical protein [Actinomycetota bacterium]